MMLHAGQNRVQCKQRRLPCMVQKLKGCTAQEYIPGAAHKYPRQRTAFCRQIEFFPEMLSTQYTRDSGMYQQQTGLGAQV